MPTLPRSVDSHARIEQVQDDTAVIRADARFRSCAGWAYRPGMSQRKPSPHERDEPALPDAQGVDPTDLLRAMLAIRPEDAAAVREDAAEAMRPAGWSPEQ